MTQMGIECIGLIDDYQVCEVITLAAQSLSCIAEGTVLALSDLELMRSIVEGCGVPEEKQDEVFACVRDRNASALNVLCSENGWDETALGVLIGCYGRLGDVLEQLEKKIPASAKGQLKKLYTLVKVLDEAGCADQVQMDFSVANDMKYYNGLVFQGFVPDVPVSVLSGGQYDRLVAKMGGKGGAIGFAVYVDALEMLDRNEVRTDADVLLLYGEADGTAEVLHQAAQLRTQGKRVLVMRKGAESTARVGQTVEFRKGGDVQ